ncbi:MAG: YitT family protein [Bulleidia sp.]|nr:YitT family protein [Bulleidia sp.]
MLKELNRHKEFRNLVTLCAVIQSGFMQAAIIQIFMRPLNLLSSGFTGVAILVEKITSTYFGFTFSTSLGMLVLNIPIALFCCKSISKRFTFFSLLQVIIASFFLKVIHFEAVFDDRLLNIIFGGFLYGMQAVIALKANASTGGTDFVALYISNKKNKSIFSYVFIFNAMLLIIFGMMFGWENAGYSILFQFISTKTIDTFYNRYARMTLQITTSKPDAIIQCLIKNYRHGLSRVDGIGGYSGRNISLIHVVVSSYEVSDIVALMRSVDPHVIVNVMKTENFYGGFYLKPIE